MLATTLDFDFRSGQELGEKKESNRISNKISAPTTYASADRRQTRGRMDDRESPRRPDFQLGPPDKQLNARGLTVSRRRLFPACVQQSRNTDFP